MMVSVQLVLAVALLAFVGLWRRAQARRKQWSWDEIVAALRANDWGIDEVSERYLYRGGIKATPADIWKRIDGARGLWAMYCNAPLLVQLADYAAEHGTDPRHTPPHAWHIAFAPTQTPKVAVAVLVENGADRLSATGGALAAPIGRAVIQAALQGGP